jgi:hypothetical protein
MDFLSMVKAYEAKVNIHNPVELDNLVPPPQDEFIEGQFPCIIKKDSGGYAVYTNHDEVKAAVFFAMRQEEAMQMAAGSSAFTSYEDNWDEGGDCTDDLGKYLVACGNAVTVLDTKEDVVNWVVEHYPERKREDVEYELSTLSD